MYSVETNKRVNKQKKPITEHTPMLLVQDVSAKKASVNLSQDDLSISIGDLKLKANESGEEFVSGMYLAAFDQDGNVVDAIHSNDFEELAKNLNGVYVVGISMFEDRPGFASFFYGRISLDGRWIVQKPLIKNVHLSATEIIAGMLSKPDQ
jgi:hypothetical protein